ncbi:MAG: BON domain-containing protein [Chitinispirillaceae bacterium]
MVNEELEHRILEQLHWDARLENADVHAEVADGKVVLRGIVSSLAQLRAAELSVWSVQGVASVDNRLRILHGTEKEDEEIEAALSSRLKDDREIDESAIQFTVEEGLITLFGSVDAYWKKERVEEIASHTSGTVLVENKLEVVPTSSPDDRRIAEDVRLALERMNAADTRHVTVTVNNGVVTLTGKVPHWNSYNSAEYAARHTRGVSDVRNELLMV